MMSRLHCVLLAALGLAFTSPSIAEPLGLLDAVRLTLAKNPDVLLQERQLEFSRGALLQAEGQFDPALRLSTGRALDHVPLLDREQRFYAAQGLTDTETRTATTHYSLALEKPFKNGLVISPEISAFRYAGTEYVLPATRGLVSFNIRIPLLKNAGRAAAAGEEAARADLEATRHELRFAVSQSVFGTVSSYWNLLGALESLQISLEAEDAIALMAGEVEKLIAADEIPAADINLVRASLLEKSAMRSAAEQALVSARTSLAQAIGVAASAAMEIEPDDELPLVKSDQPLLSEYRTRLTRLALQQRGDLAAARLREDAARIVLQASRHNLKPQLDLELRVGYAGLAEGSDRDHYLSALDRQRSGTNVMVSLNYQWPFENSIARGRLLQDSANHDQRTVMAARAERDIELGVQTAYANFRQTLEQLRDAEAAVDLYALTLENERTKHKLGTATLIDVLSVNDKLLAARLNYITYRVRVMSLIAQLNFETGTLFADNASGQLVSYQQLVSLPEPDQE